MIRTVPVVGAGTAEDPRRPDLPDGVAYTVVDDHGATMTVEVTGPDPATADAQAALTALVARVGPEGVIRSAILGADLADHAGDFWDVLAGMADEEPSRPAIEIVTHSALTAATTPLDPPTTEEP